MNAERKTGPKGKVNISNNVAITGIEKLNMDFGGDNQKALRFTFKFESKYEPDIGAITLEGDLTYLTKKEKAEELLKEWKDTKKIEPNVMTLLLNNILTKCNIEAIILSKEMGLPAPIPLPKINKPVEEKTENKKK